MMTVERSVGSRVRAERRRRNLTQVELAAKAGISEDTMNKLEGDKTQPHPRTIRKVAAALGVREECLTGGLER